MGERERERENIHNLHLEEGLESFDPRQTAFTSWTGFVGRDVSYLSRSRYSRLCMVCIIWSEFLIILL